MLVKKCPYCGNNIRINVTKFPYVNDKGGIIFKCEECSELSYCSVINPIETRVLKGAEKIDTWDNDVISKDEFILKFPNIKELKKGLVVIGDLNQRHYEFDFRKPHIYYCSNCREEIESAAYAALFVESKDIAYQYDSLMNYILANSRHECDDLVVELEVKCDCDKTFVTYWHKKFTPDSKKINPMSDLYLVGTDMPVIINFIDGVMSKNDCKRILEKFVIRWNAIYPRLLIVTPFVGHQWLSQEEIIELWDWIKNFLDPQKSSLVTRAATFNKYKKACEEKGISLDILDSYDLNNAIIQDYTKKQDFHSKIYVGYSSDRVEILMGSFNLMNGPSVENLSFKHCDYDLFTNRFINPMKIPVVHADSLNSDWLRILKKEDQWSAGRIESSKILNVIMNYL